MSTSIASTSALSTAAVTPTATPTQQSTTTTATAAASGSSTTPAVSATGTAASEQATSGAEQAQTEKAEPFNAPMLDLPDDPTSRDVMVGLTRAMADPTVNKSSAQQLYNLHEQLLAAEKAMMTAILDGMSS